MSTRVFILATCRNPKLLPATLMVFDTLRVGFPTAPIHVDDNAVPERFPEIERAVSRTGASRREVTDFSHAQWIQTLVDMEEEPFYICDTDMVFWRNFEDWGWDEPLAGRLIPEFYDPWSKMMAQPRLHTSLLYIDPVRVRKEIEEYYESIPDVGFMERPNLFESRVAPPARARGVSKWWDTCGLLAAVVPADLFEEHHLECYDHLNAGTWLDVVGQAHPGLVQTYEAALKDRTTMKGLWRRQENFYRLSRLPYQPRPLFGDQETRKTFRV